MLRRPSVAVSVVAVHVARCYWRSLVNVYEFFVLYYELTRKMEGTEHVKATVV
jgi:hypothetical protein